MSIVKKYQASKGNYKVTFSYPANEGINHVQVLGDFNNWDINQAPNLKKGKEGFSASIELNAGNSYEFRYLINGNQWENDHQADKLVPALFGSQNSLVTLDAAKKAAAPKAVKVVAGAKTVKPAKPATAKPATAKATATKAPVAKKAKAEIVASVKTVKVVAAKPAKKTVTKPKSSK